VGWNNNTADHETNGHMTVVVWVGKRVEEAAVLQVLVVVGDIGGGASVVL
jgi:hypothetical protein